MAKLAGTATYIVDDHHLVRSTIESILIDLGLAVQSFASGIEFLEAQPSLAPGAVFLDVRMPKLDGLGVLSHLRQSWAETPVVMISGHADVPMAVSAMRSGASYFLEKPFSRDTIEMVVETVLKPNREPGAEPPDSEARQHVLGSLTARELDVLKRLVAGDGNKKIGLDLGISPRTVEVHRAKIMLRLGTQNFAELIRLALAAGIEANEIGRP